MKEIENEIDGVCPNCLAFGVHCPHRVNGDPYHYDCKMTVYVLEKENAELKKELESYKALDSHYDEIEEDSKRIAEENEQLKEHIREVENDSNNCEHWSYTRIKQLEEQIEKMKTAIISFSIANSIDEKYNSYQKLLELAK